MSNEFGAGAAIGGLAGTVVAGLPGAFVGSALGGLLADAYSKKPSAGSFATTVRNDLAPENVTLDAHQIYVRITTGHGLGSLLAASDTANQLSASFADRMNQIAAARSASEEAWLGEASAAAAAATTSLSDSFATAQAQLAMNSQALNAEVAAFDHIHSQVEPVPPTPPQSSIANAVNPFQTDVDAAINEYNAKAAKNIQLYEAYSADTAAARSQVPQSYAQVTPLSASATAVGRTASPIGTATPSASPPGGSAAAQPPTTNKSAAAGGDPSASQSPGGGASSMPGGTAGQGAAATDPNVRQSPPTTTPMATTPGGIPPMSTGRDAYVGSPITPMPRPNATSDAQRKLAGAGPGVGGAGSFSGGGFAGTPGITPGITTGGPPTVGGPAMRGGGSAAGVGPVQPSPGQGQAVGRGGVGAPGARGAAAGMGGVPMGAPGRGNGEEDQEHRNKYVIEPDSDELFGVDEQYAPPVIGEHP